MLGKMSLAVQMFNMFSVCDKVMEDYRVSGSWDVLGCRFVATAMLLTIVSYTTISTMTKGLFFSCSVNGIVT